MAALSDGSKVVVSAVPGYRESTENWSEVLRDIKRRGSCPRLVVGDGHLGIWGALRNVYPQAAEQRCWIPQDRKRSPSFQSDNRTRPSSCCVLSPYAPTRTEAERLRTVFTQVVRRPFLRGGLRGLGATGTAWSPSMTFQRSTGGTSHDEPGRITLKRPSGFGPMPPSATRGSIGR